MSNYKEHLRHITTFIFDYDGVLSDGTILVFDSGDHVRVGSVKDGYAIQLALKKGYRVAVMSGAVSDSISRRCSALGISEVFFGVKDKKETYRQYLVDNKLTPREVLFMGDDIPDYHVMKEAGVAVCPADAAEEIKSVAAYISQFGGGRGCVRDIVEQVLKVQGKWMDDDAFTW
jgi:3-deoxy-D-manno-octulosonate 8-phosphate phosphatase (KDO 8-P phosphatase)